MLADQVRTALNGSEEEFTAYLESNELWGGSGSIADQAGVDASSDQRRAILDALIALGEAQIRSGVTNARTEIWVEAFQPWRGREP